MKALDGGAYGLICPMVNSTPRMPKSWWPGHIIRAERHAEVSDPIAGVALWRCRLSGNMPMRTVVVFAMIETQQAGLDNLDDILRVPGLDAVYIGPVRSVAGIGVQP